MRTKHLPMKTLFAGFLAVIAGGFGCSDGGSEGDDGAGTSGGSGGMSAGGTGGSGPVATGGTPNTWGQPAMGGVTSAGGAAPSAGGSAETGGTASGTGGSSMGGSSTGGASAGGANSGGTSMGGANTGGSAGGGTDTGGNSSGGAGMGGSGMAGSSNGGAGLGGSTTGAAGSAGSEAGGADTGGSAGSGGAFTGTCTASQDTGRRVSGSGPHQVVVETNSDAGIACGTIYRPADLGGDERYPILVWGEGGCSQDGLSNQAAMGEIASWGYFVVADGTPGAVGACQGGQDGAAFLDYITWAIAENEKPCSAYYQSLDTAKIAADGFSCGGLMAENASGDPRFTAIGITSSGLLGPSAGIYDGIHTPFKIMNGGPEDIAYENGLNDYEEISSRGIPIVYFSKTTAGHGGDLSQARGDFNLVNLAWLNWQLKGDEGATGKGFLHGATCEFCADSGWDYRSANID